MSLETFGDVNYVAVLAAAVAYFALGALWYSPVLFARPWMQLSGVRPEEGSGGGAIFVFTFIAQLVAALALGFLAAAAEAEGLGQGLLLGVIVAIGFVITAMVVTGAFDQRPAKLQAINIGYHVVGLLVAGAIVGVWS